MSRWVLCLVFGFGILGIARAAEPSAAETELRRITQEMLDAIAPGNAEVWRRYLHERVILVDENGTVRTKAEMLKEFSPLPPGLVGNLEIATFRIETFGDVAVLAYEAQEHLDYHGQILQGRYRINDTWLKMGETWQLLAEQVAAVLKDPPSVKLTQQQLCEYNGSYAMTSDIVTKLQCTQDGFSAERTGRPSTQYLAEVPDVFFVAGQPRTRRIFLRDSQGKVVGFVDRREGEDVRWMKKS
jgi:hypothetical protein